MRQSRNLEHFPTKWLPGSSEKMRQSKCLERFPESIRTETAQAAARRALVAASTAVHLVTRRLS
jgi:hypothetical protein